MPRTAVAQLPAPSPAVSTHRILDEKVRAALISRVIWIQKQIFLDVPYAEIGRQLWNPNRVEVSDANPAALVSVVVDSLVPFAGVTAHKTLQGQWVFGENDIRLEIVANIDAPEIQASQSNNSAFLTERGFKMETAYHEQLAGTNIAINVYAGSKDGEFVKRVSECLRQPPESFTKKVAQLSEQLSNGKNLGAASQLIQIGESAPVIAALDSNSPAIRESAIIACARIGPAGDAVTPLIQLLKTGDPRTRGLAAWALSVIHREDKTTVAALVAAVDEGDLEGRRGAVQALGEFKTQEKTIVPVLIRMLAAPEPSLRLFAATSLHRLGPITDPDSREAAYVALRKSLGDQDGDVRSIAAMALGTNKNAEQK